MKTKKVVIALTLILGILITICMSDGTAAEAKGGTVKLNYTKKTIFIGRDHKLRLINATGDVVWSSSDESIAKVKDGVVSGLKVGSVIITATNQGVTYESKIKVKEPGLNYSSKRIRINNSFTL